MMIHETHFGARLSEMIREGPESAILVRHACVQPRGIQHIQIGNWILTAQEALQICGKDGAGSRPALADEIELVGPHLYKVQAGTNGEARKGCIVLDPADALLGHGKKQLAVTRNARGRIMHLRIVEAQSDHSPRTLDFLPAHQVIALPSPVTSSTEPPAAVTVSRTVATSNAVPRQLFPASSIGRPSAVVIRRPRPGSPRELGISTIRHAIRPFQFIVGVRRVLN